MYDERDSYSYGDGDSDSEPTYCRDCGEEINWQAIRCEDCENAVPGEIRHGARFDECNGLRESE